MFKIGFTMYRRRDNASPPKIYVAIPPEITTPSSASDKKYKEAEFNTVFLRSFFISNNMLPNII